MNSLLQTLKEKPVWGLLLIELLFFFRPVFFGEVFYYRDLHSHFLPKRELVAEYLSELELPLWDPYLQGGKPLLGNPNNMALYPSNLLYLFFSGPRALTIEIILHHLMAMLAVYIFCRTLSLRQPSSFIAAVIYGFSGYMLSAINLLNWFIALSYLPVLFCFWHLYLLHGKRKWWLCSVFAASFQMLAGAPELSMITFITLLGWSCFYRYPAGIGRIFLKWAALFFLTIALCAIQILPALELSRFTVRATGFGFDSTMAWSLHPYRIFEFIFPGMLGKYDSISPTSYWGQNLEGELPFILSVYFGLTSLALAVAGTFLNQKRKDFPRSLRLFLFTLILVCILLALGRYLPGLSWIFDFFSFRSPFRFPVKLLTVVLLPLSLLTAIGSEILFTDQNKISKTITVIFWAIEIVLLFMVIFVFVWADPISKTVFNQTLNPQIKRGIANAVLHCFYLWTLACICIAYIRKYRWAHAAVAMTLLLDLLVSGISINMSAPAELLTNTPKLATLVKGKINEGKLYRSSKVDLSRLRTPSEDVFWRFWVRQEMLVSYLPSKYEIPVIFHDDLDGSALVELNYMRLVLDSLPWPRKLKILSASGVTLILNDEMLNDEMVNDEGVSLITKILSLHGSPLYLYANKDALTPLTFVSRSMVANSFPEALQLMTKPEYNPVECVVLVKNGKKLEDDCSQFRILQQERRKQKQNYIVEARCDGYLVFTDVHYPGWRILMNGKEVLLKKANAIYFSIAVPKGRHHIKKAYFPESVLRGTACSIATLVVLVVLAFKRNSR
ncbi:hypothetical protein L0222_07705 [bacterium]|nr:hypothetical protein [bacterium]